MKSEAVIFPGPERVEVGTIELPEPGPEDALVEIEYSAVSNGTERWCLTGKLDVPGHPSPEFPHVPGYQAAGIVTQTGSAVENLVPGDRVFSRNCRAPSGWNGSWWGGHVKHHVADAAGDVIKLDENLTTFAASGLLLAQVGYNGASKPAEASGGIAAVIGDGLVGQYAAQVLRARGVRVILSGLIQSRLELAARFSADEVYDNSRDDFTEFMADKFPQGVDIVLDAAGKGKTVREGIGMLKRHGHLIMNGFYSYPDESRLDWHWLRRKELTIHFPDSRNRERLVKTMRLIGEGSMRVEELVTHIVRARDAAGAYRMLLDPNADFLGVVIDWCSV